MPVNITPVILKDGSTAVGFKDSTQASSATPTPTGDARFNDYWLTALAAAAAFAAPTGTAVRGNRLTIAVKDNATARALTWNAIYRSMGATLPATTILSKWMYITFIYNATDTKWDCLSVVTEP
jgi:hypothetical protein